MIYKGKIFQLGLTRTGSTSFSEAVRVLGYTSRHNPTLLRKQKNILHYYLSKYDVLSDVPVIIKRLELNKLFPSAKWVLTIRDKNSWMKSCKTFFKLFPTRKSSAIRAVRKIIYGAVCPNEKVLSESYDKWYEILYVFVKEKDHIIMNICDGDGWDKLCPFLNCPVPKVAFPHSSSSLTLTLK